MRFLQYITAFTAWALPIHALAVAPRALSLADATTFFQNLQTSLLPYEQNINATVAGLAPGATQQQQAAAGSAIKGNVTAISDTIQAAKTSLSPSKLRRQTSPPVTIPVLPEVLILVALIVEGIGDVLNVAVTEGPEFVFDAVLGLAGLIALGLIEIVVSVLLPLEEADPNFPDAQAFDAVVQKMSALPSLLSL